MAWLALFVAGLFETGWAMALKASDGLTRPRWVVATALALLVSMSLLAWAMRTLPLGTAYAVWVGIGAVGAAVVGVLWFGEPLGVGRVVSLGLVLAGIIGLKLTAGPAVT